MQTLTFQEIEIKYFYKIEKFCFDVLKNEAEALINAANVFTTFQKMVADGFFDKVKSEDDIQMSLFLIARTICIQRLQWLRSKEEQRNPIVLFFDRIIKRVKLCLKII